MHDIVKEIIESYDAGAPLSEASTIPASWYTDPRVFELRTYTVPEGKMDALHTRFRDITCKYFEKHGMTVVGFWNPTDPKEAKTKLVYLLAHPSKEAAEKNWKALAGDADFRTAFAATEMDGKLVDKVESVFLNPADYSLLK